MAQPPIRGGTLLETFDLTPTWRGMIRVLILGLTNGTPEAQRSSQQELERMAGALDAASERIANCHRYSAALNALEIVPNGDDFSKLFDMLAGAEYADPKSTAR